MQGISRDKIKAVPKFDFGKILAPHNRGVLLDIVVFVFQLILLNVLVRLFSVLSSPQQDNAVAGFFLVTFYLGITFLQPIGAILKRRRAHERNSDLELFVEDLGCLSFFYFLAQLLFLMIASFRLVDLVFDKAQPTWLFMAQFLGIPALAIASTAITWFYFKKPKHSPIVKFLQTPQSEAIGDAFLFLNMIGHQMVWGLVTARFTKADGGLGMRIFLLGFAFLLIYLPPRMFYLAEDGDQPRTWLTMLLANSPAIFRTIFV